MFVATMHTENYSFTAVGRDEEEARVAMRQTMRRHQSQHRFNFNGDALPWSEWPDGVDISLEDRLAEAVQRAEDAGSLADPADLATVAWDATLDAWMEYYSCNVDGPLGFGMPGFRDHEPIFLREPAR